MPNADGSVVIRTDLDNSQLEKEYAKTVKKVSRMEYDLNAKKSKRASAQQESGRLSAMLDSSKKKLAEMQAAADGVFSAKQIAYQEQAVSALQRKWEAAQSEVERYDKQIAKATADIDIQKRKAAELSGVIDQNAKATNKLGDSFGGVKKRIGETSARMLKMTASMLAFRLIFAAIQAGQNYLTSVINGSDQLSASLGRLKGALLTMVQPLTNIIIPAFSFFINLLTAVISKIAAFTAMLGGTTVAGATKAAKAFNTQTKAIKGTGAAAQKAAKALAGFDEINRLDAPDAGGGGGGGGGGAAGIEPDFAWADGVTEELSRIADYVMLIAAGLALWKISSYLPGALSTIATVAGGLLITLGGIMLLWDGVADALENGVDWTNLLEMVGGLAAAAGGLYIAFGSVAAGIALIAGGLTLLVVGFKDATKNGLNLKNTLLIIAGIVATGLGITLLTGSLLPLLIAGIAALLLALTAATGHGEELIEGVRDVCQGFVDFITGVFSGDMEKALGGIEKMFDGLGKIVDSIILGVRDTILSFLDWLDQKTHGKLSGVIGSIKTLVTGFFDNMRKIFSNSVDGLKQIFLGITTFISGVFTGNWERAWSGLKTVFKGIWNSIVGTIEGGMNLIVDGINWVIRQINKIKITMPDWVPGIGGKYFGPNISTMSRVSLPRLAEGAVIPPNREFMAILGDQKHGTNIEAPLSTIKQAVGEETEDIVPALIAGFEAMVREQQATRQVLESLDIDGEMLFRIYQAYTQKMAVARGG